MGISYLALVTDFLSRLPVLNDREKRVVQDSVSYAVNQTRLHIANTRQNQSDVPSAILSNIWMETAQRLSKVGNEEVKSWADMLREKARYWSDPKGYNLQHLQEYQIRLTDVEDKLNTLIT